MSPIVAIVACALLGLGWLSAICIGADGHVDFESLVEQHHAPSALANAMGPETAGGEGLGKQTAHGPCVDVLLDQVFVTQLHDGAERTDSILKASSVETYLPAASAGLDQVSTVSCRVLGRLVASKFSLRVVRSTILRI